MSTARRVDRRAAEEILSGLRRRRASLKVNEQYLANMAGLDVAVIINAEAGIMPSGKIADRIDAALAMIEERRSYE